MSKGMEVGGREKPGGVRGYGYLQVSWACWPESIMAGLVDSWKEGVGRLMEPSPKYPATPPNQLYVILS